MCARSPAQGPTFVAKDPPLVLIRADRVPKILEQWPQTALGKLFADEDGAYAGKLGLRYSSHMIQRHYKNHQSTKHIDIR